MIMALVNLFVLPTQQGEIQLDSEYKYIGYDDVGELGIVGVVISRRYS
jgi:hypothetical protein